MKRFHCIREGHCTLKIYDGHNKFLADFQQSGSKYNLYDMKNDKVQYTISRKENSDPPCYFILQDYTSVAEFIPSPSTTIHSLAILAPKYGSNIEVIFTSKTDFIAKREDITISCFGMINATNGYLDIAKGERRNFSFAFMALFVIWCDHLSEFPSSKNEEKSNKNSKISEKSEGSASDGEGEGRGGDVGDKSDEEEESVSDDQTTGTTARSKRPNVQPLVLSARSAIPLKSPRVNIQAGGGGGGGGGSGAVGGGSSGGSVGPLSSRREQSSNSVLNALLKKNRPETTPVEANNKV